MIGSLRGTVSRKKSDMVLIEVNGVGYEVHVPISVLTSLPTEGQGVFLYIYTHVREDILQLYGFLKEEERFIFMKVLSVSGVGPKIALAALSGLSAEKFASAVNSNDIDTLTAIPGIGKKTASRIVLELKEKLPVSTTTFANTDYEDAMSALLNLGYKRTDVIHVLDQLNKKGVRDIESLLKESLKYLSKTEQ
ncbi:Holliday junction branch migration protein RuvA [Candidatus Magnetominusculus xianensis]|uniref:Holliday junction branch migration complex subunit RuvA n=1 Tax=Candidatus Magnetominusculus xianensis TaxID=1748249 RepID=A0ABR5SKW0_9BACT|nr:Holliday junction branch migration protein RuvA [Candidatus Magnetominusculus xianensis]KWT95099.1 holliday junction ATP-dependent DNA helicase RuvA [Candidatus Magnetominusculus xianensis]MBF0402747.1 Holliday junction branch migration protein RuvA [Nitrospirota bacterium]